MHRCCQINAMFVGFGGPFCLTCARRSRSMLPAIWLRLAADTSDVVERGSGRCSYTGVDVRAEVEVGPEKRQKHHPLFTRGTTNDMSKQQSCDCCSICLNSLTDLDNKGCVPNHRAYKTPSSTLLNVKQSERERGLARQFNPLVLSSVECQPIFPVVRPLFNPPFRCARST